MLTRRPSKLLPATFPRTTATGLKISETHAFLLIDFCPASYASTAKYQKELKHRGILRADFEIASSDDHLLPEVHLASRLALNYTAV
jgi:hypothetical protein